MLTAATRPLRVDAQANARSTAIASPDNHRRDHDDICALAELDARDAPGQVQVGLDALERRLVLRRTRIASTSR